MALGKKESIRTNIMKNLDDIHTFISWHYTRGSVYDTPFWRTAQAETTNMFKQPNEEFEQFVDLAKSLDYMECRASEHIWYGQWPIGSIKLWYDEYIK